MARMIKKVQPTKEDAEIVARKNAEYMLTRLLKLIRSGKVKVVSAGEWGNNSMDTELTTRVIWKK